MASVLEVYTTEEQRSVVRFLWAKGLNAKDIHKDMFPVYGGMCLLCKAVHNWVEKFSQGRSKVAGDARPGAEVAETTVNAAGFDALCKATGQVYQCWWRIRRKVFSLWFEYHVLCFISICGLLTDFPSY
jgi:hypothetical protein